MLPELAGTFAGRLLGNASHPRAKTAIGTSGNSARQTKVAAKLA